MLPLDYAAVAMAFCLLLALVVFAGCGIEVPQELRQGFALALGWVFRGGAQAVNGYMKGRNTGAKQ